MAMKRRQLLLCAFAIAHAPAAFAANPPWSARLLKGGFDGKVWWAGLHVTLAPKWKTYWRVPGEGGIAPQLDVKGGNIAAHEVLYPLPRRYEDEAGMTIGYIDEVVFPIAIEPTDASKPINLSLTAFFGVCEVVCIPAQLEESIVFDPAVADAPDQALISRWQGPVPRVQTPGPVTKAVARMENGKLWLDLDKPMGARDVFVEGKAGHYFGKPTLMRGIALLPVTGATSEADLRGSQLRITLDSNAGAIEQQVTVE
jgi:DsbC/DsbD-like thiol-disulfide interchange protein